MRLYKTILFSLLWLLSVTVAAQEKRYSVDFDQTPIEQVIRDLRQQTGYEFVYQREVVKNIQPVTRRLHDVTLHELLDQVIRMDAGLDYEIVKESIVLKRPEPKAQTGKNTVSGVVVDEKGDPMPYVTVKVKGTDRGVITDQAGQFSISLDNLDMAVVEFSYLGFKTVSRTYHPVKPTKSQRIVMHEDEGTLGEVVVTGYQVLDKRSLTSA
ncbi:MAG: carboxypeptidase-like regulatory domain-containing protein, partial [Prevotella sp.]|nr:carboxypeptidase-like regulatory domain-containing protein [Prevotella sp.]